MKISDKIAYLGRDLEDAQRLGILSENQRKELDHILLGYPMVEAANNTNFIHVFITDLCRNSTPEKGLCFSKEVYELMKMLMKFNYQNIYKHPRLKNYESYAKMVIRSIFEALSTAYAGERTLGMIKREVIPIYPKLGRDFLDFIEILTKQQGSGSRHKRIYDLTDERSYLRAIIDFISLLTDRTAIDFFNELTSF